MDFSGMGKAVSSHFEEFTTILDFKLSPCSKCSLLSFWVNPRRLCFSGRGFTQKKANYIWNTAKA
jgi:hypothetical protein